MSICVYDKCMCCGSKTIVKVLTCKDYTVTHQEFEVWECSNCTFRFTQNAPDEESISPYYQSATYVSHSDTKQGFVNRLYHVVRDITLKSKLGLVKNLTGLSKGYLLDVGAGTGAFVNTMKSAGWHVTGLEPDSTARENALENYNLTLEESKKFYQLESNSFDVITMWHVLEHVHDLHGYLQTLNRILKPEGKLIIAVPNYTSYDAKVYKQYWAAYDVPRHLWHFSPKSMGVLIEEEGFVMEEIKPMWFDSFYVSMLSEKYQSGKHNYLRAVWNGFLSNLKTFADTQRCSSVIYVVSKKAIVKL